MIPVTISIVTYNSEKYIGTLLDSIFKEVINVDYHIYIIDNCSTDNTISIINSKKNERVTLIQSPSNVGFGKGHNTIIPRLTSKYHVFINPDIQLKNDVIGELARYLDANEDIGIVTPKILFPDGQLQILPKCDPRLSYLISRRINIPFMQKYRDAYEMSDKDAGSAFDIQFCTGAFMFVRTEILKQVGGFDERYFLYFEDADLSREFRRLTRTQYNPNFIIYHNWERAGAKSTKYLFMQLASMFKYMHKWRHEK